VAGSDLTPSSVEVSDIHQEIKLRATTAGAGVCSSPRQGLNNEAGLSDLVTSEQLLSSLEANKFPF
jgi:hypothetical protein